ncbi:MAG: hypothetical protein NVS4B11_24850 [Ktedonobacteraceae bacterium]
MQEALHHGHVVREYRELKAGITQEELASRIGRSRRTVVSLEQGAKISDTKLRRTLAWALQIPPQLLGLPDDALTDAVVLKPLEQTVEIGAKNLSRVVLETFNDNLRMRLDLSMTRMRARLYIQYAEALFASRDMSCCFYALEALKLARSVRSPRNIQRVKELASKLHALSPRDGRVKELLLAL